MTTITLSDISILGAKAFVPGAQAIAGYQLTSGGVINKDVNGTLSSLGDWISPQSGESNYECEFTVVSGTLSWGTTGSWLDMGNTNDFGVTENIAGSNTAKVTVAIRDKATHTTQATCTVTVTASLFH